MSKTSDREIDRIIRLMRRDESYDAPPDAVRWSKNIFLGKAVEPKKSFVERVTAVLQINLSPNRAAFGERSASTSQARQMLFQAGDTSIDLRIKKDKKGTSVLGQILGEGFANCMVKLGEFETATNEISEFNFADIPGGKYALRLQSLEKEIVVEDIEVE
jgi:hypothetical protein